MAIRSIPPCWYRTTPNYMCDLLIVNYNPHGTICPICRQHVGRIYTYYPGAPMPPALPLHDHCYCWYERTNITIIAPVDPPGPPPSDPPWMPAPIKSPTPEPIWEQVPTPPGSPWSPFAVTPALYPEPEEPEEPGYPPPGSGMDL